MHVHDSLITVIFLPLIEPTVLDFGCIVVGIPMEKAVLVKNYLSQSFALSIKVNALFPPSHHRVTTLHTCTRRSTALSCSLEFMQLWNPMCP